MTQKTRIQRFDFGSMQDFRGPIVIQTMDDELSAEPAAPPPPPSFTEADLENVRLAGRKQGYNEGFNAGQLEATKNFDRATEATNEVIAHLSGCVSELTKRYAALIHDESAQLSKLVLAVARKVAGDALNERSEQIIASTIAQALPILFSKPRAVIEVHPELMDRVADRIEKQLRESNFEGEVQFKSNPALAKSDITIDWGTGQMQRQSQNLWEEVEQIIARVPLEITFNETLAQSAQQQE